MLDLLRDVVGQQLGSLGTWPYAVLINETVLEATTLDHLDGLLKVLFGLPAKTDDEVARYGRPRQHVSDAIHHRVVVARRVTPLHPLENHIAAALGRHVQIRHALGQVPDRLEQLPRHVLGVTGHKFDPFDPLDRMEHLQQIGQPSRSLSIDPTVGIDRLTEQRNLLGPLLCQDFRFPHNLLGRPALLGTSRHRNDAVRTELVASDLNPQIGLKRSRPHLRITQGIKRLVRTLDLLGTPLPTR